MKILFIYNAEISQRYANVLSLLKNIETLINLGNDVTLIVKRTKWTSNIKQELAQSAEHYGVEKSPKVLAVFWPFRFFGRAFAYIATLYSFFIKPDLVWSRDIFSAFLVSKLGETVLLEHHTMLSERSLRYIKSVQKLKNFKGIISISNQHKKKLINSGLLADKLKVAHSGVDVDYISRVTIGATNVEKGAQPLIIYAGSFYEGRGIDIIESIATAMPNIKFCCIGGLRESDLENLYYLDKMARKELIRYLNRADVLIAPYTRNSLSISGENIAQFQSPLKLMEYLAIGKPIISTNIGAIPEIIETGVNGILLEERDIDGMILTIERILEDDTLRKRLSKNAKIRAQIFNWEDRVRKILEYVSR